MVSIVRNTVTVKREVVRDYRSLKTNQKAAVVCATTAASVFSLGIGSCTTFRKMVKKYKKMNGERAAQINLSFTDPVGLSLLNSCDMTNEMVFMLAEESSGLRCISSFSSSSSEIDVPLPVSISTLKRAFKIPLNFPFYFDSRTNRRIYGFATDTAFEIYYKFSNVLLQRFHKSTKSLLDHEIYLPAIRMICITLAIKMLSDDAIWNRDLIKDYRIKISIYDFNRLEMLFLQKIEYYVDVDFSELSLEIEEEQQDQNSCSF